MGSARRDGLPRALARAVGDLGLAGRRIAVAVSGGVDSTVLAHALAGLAERTRLGLSIAHVNHSLRGAGSDADEAFVRALAAELGVPFAVARVDPLARVRGAPSSRARPTVQEAARQLRRAALRRLADELGAEHVATAHTADDQAETVLLRVLRGAGPPGVGGIPERSPDGLVVRPFLRVARAEIVAWATGNGLRWREDPSNADVRFARARLRRDWLPGLAAAFNPGLLRAIGDLAEAQRRESEWIGVLIEREAARRFASDGDGALRIDPKGWEADSTPDGLARRLARLALHRTGAARHVTRAHLDRMVGFLRSGRPGRVLELPDGLTLARTPRCFRLGRRLPPEPAC